VVRSRSVFRAPDGFVFFSAAPFPHASSRIVSRFHFQDLREIAFRPESHASTTDNRRCLDPFYGNPCLQCLA
jgi:hypothetical protein